jgi:hypothetical protein
LDHFDPDFASLDLAAIIKLSELAFAVESLAAFETHLADLKVELEAKDEAADRAEDNQAKTPAVP